MGVFVFIVKDRHGHCCSQLLLVRIISLSVVHEVFTQSGITHRSCPLKNKKKWFKDFTCHSVMRVKYMKEPNMMKHGLHLSDMLKVFHFLWTMSLVLSNIATRFFFLDFIFYVFSMYLTLDMGCIMCVIYVCMDVCIPWLKLRILWVWKDLETCGM